MQPQEKCPVCESTHQAGPMTTYDENGVKPSSFPDVECCQPLRWAVTIFKMTDSGYILRPRKDIEQPRH